MPIFEYECRKCGHQFEQLVSRAEADKVKCARCKTPKAKRRLSVFGVSSAASGRGKACPVSDGGACPMPAGGHVHCPSCRH